MGASGKVALDAYVIDVLMHDLVGHDRAPSAFIVYIHLWRHSDGGRTGVRASLRDVADGTGLSKRGVQQALVVLRRRRVVSITRYSITDVPTYHVVCPWRRG